MSIKVMSWVWDVSTLKGSDKLLMLCLADHADDNGMCWPSIETMARKSGISVSTVKSTLKKLEGAGWLTKRNRFKTSNSGRVVRDSNQYQLSLSALKTSSDDLGIESEGLNFEPPSLEGSDLEQPKSEHSKSEHSNFEQSERGVFNSQNLARGRPKSGYKPSLDPSIDPPIKDLAPNKLNQIANDRLAYSLMLKGGKTHPVMQSHIPQLESLYPGVDIHHQLRMMALWCLNNPKNRKTKAGVSRFIESWLSKEQSKVLSFQTTSSALSPSEEFRRYLHSQGRSVRF
ncbi:helix-turn-helix domain-containing protein [Vibrio mediterranei]|uniref:Helix-turn-helix domain-containing protein n=1 Tax=Vibrio mediterranei TaxID=689 RepID=A0AAN1FKU5_9VIBR|nr:helix-turn-helix domain-containing protein [Vibrio mediterranei]ASI92471.1 hypothetical protein BSZ05_21980 [Vibrio mediterranei]